MWYFKECETFEGLFMLRLVLIGLWLTFLEIIIGLLIRVRGFPERRMQVPVCGTGRGLASDAGFDLVVVVLVVAVVPPP